MVRLLTEAANMDAKRNKGVLAVDTDAKTGSGVPTYSADERLRN